MIGGEGRLPLLPAPLFVSVFFLLLVSVGLGTAGSGQALAQTSDSTAPSTGDQAPQSGQSQSQPDQGQPQPGQLQPGQVQPAPAQPFQPYQPGQPPRPQQVTPPQWTPPVPPAPSQSHVPGPFTPPAGIPPGAVFDWHLTASLSEEYSDNFNLSAKNRESNFRTTLAPGSVFFVNTPKTQGSLSASWGFAHDTAGGESDVKFFPALSAAVQHTFEPRLSLTLTDSFTRNDEPTLADATGLRGGRRTFISNSFGASVAWLIDLLQTNYYYQNSYFDSETVTISHVFGVGASTRLGELNTVSAGYEYSLSQPQSDVTSHGNLFTASFSRRLGAFATAGVQGSYSTQSLGGQKIWNASFFSTYGLPTGLSVSSRIGYSRLTADNVSSQDGFSTSTVVSYAHARGVISVGVFQDFRTTFQGSQNFQTGQAQSGQNFGVVESRGFTGSFSYQLTPFISSFISSAYYQNTNTGVGNVKSDSSQDYWTASAGISWQLLRWLGMQVQYTRNQYTKPDRDENRGLISFNAYF